MFLEDIKRKYPLVFEIRLSELVNHMDKLAALCVPCGYEGFIDRVMD